MVHLPTLTELRSYAEGYRPPITGWPQVVLIAAGFYNLAFGAWAILFPGHYFFINGMEPLHLNLWQCIGMIVALYGLGYLIASSDISRFWPLVFIGLLGKIFGPVGYVYGLVTGETKLSGIPIIIFNDIIWWIPFALILIRVLHENWRAKTGGGTEVSDELAKDYQSLDELCGSKEKLLLVFIRHIGCTFAREALDELVCQRGQLRERGVEPVVVHMGSSLSVKQWLSSRGCDDLLCIADEKQLLYSYFGVERGTVFDAFSPKIFFQAIPAVLKKRLGVGMLDGDGYQLGASFLLKKGRVIASRINENVSNGYSFIDLLEASSESQHPAVTLYYDEQCPICKVEIDFLRTLTPKGKVSYVDISSPNFESCEDGKTCDLLMKEIHAKTEDGEWLVGMDAFRAVYRFTPYGSLMNATSLPIIRPVSDFAYQVFARNRLWLTGRSGSALLR